MTIRECTIEDIDAASQLAHLCNVSLGQTSSFMYKELPKVASGFAATLGKNSLQFGAFENNVLVGYVHVVDDEVFGSGDVLGPFVPNGSQSTAKLLLEGLKDQSSHIPKFKFNVNPSSFLVQLLSDLGATENEHNYSLILSKANKPGNRTNPERVHCCSHLPANDQELINLFAKYFEDSYINAQEILRLNEVEYDVIDLTLDGRCIGFACFRSSLGYIDFVAVDPEWQGRGFGRYLLGRAIELIRSQDPTKDIRLNVDLDSTSALRLYSDMGFEVREEFVSFHLDNSSS